MEVLHWLSEVAPTPNIDRLANEGMRFDKCYVTNSTCDEVMKKQ